MLLYNYYADPPGTIVANDFNNYIGKRLSDEKFEALKSNCILPSTFKFPSKTECGEHRSFNPQCVNEYAWYHTHLFKMEYH